MTREEALQILRYEMQTHIASEVDLHIAMGMAIEALSAQTDGDLISRQAAMAYPLSWEHYDKEHGDSKFICGVESYREYIERLPSTEPPYQYSEAYIEQIRAERDFLEELVNEMAKQRTGHWIIDGHHMECSVCGVYMCKTDREGDPIPKEFCPHCGADMRGDNNER